MATLKIIKDGDETLRKKSKPVEKITPRILTLIEDMKETLAQANGVGLAAPQVGVLRRVVVIDVDGGNPRELINPEIISWTKERQNEAEGCLSVPGKWAITDRPAKVTVRAMDAQGRTFEWSGDGILARAICHEIDHLNGVLFYDNAIRILDKDEIEEE